MNVIERIQGNYDSLTVSEQQAASFILGHLTDVLLCSSAELSTMSGVSQPTLSRLYRKLGYRNAGEFKRDVRKNHQPGSPETATPDSPTHNPLNDQLRQDITSLERTYSRISPDTLDDATSRILNSRRVVLFGMRNNYPAALHLREQLIQIRHGVHVIPQPGQSISEEIEDLTQQDLAILFGVRRRTRLFTPLAKNLHSHQVQLVMIGDSTLRGLAALTEAIFFEIDLSSRVLSSFTSAFSVVSLLADSAATLAHQQSSTVNRSVGHHEQGTAGSDARITAINERFAQLNELEKPF